MFDVKLSVVITVFSETFSLVETIDRLLKLSREYTHEIILVVSPYSSKECLEICEKLAKQNSLIRLHIQKQNPGAGWAIREGMELASGTHIALLSADLETEPEAVDRMIRKIEETGCDGVIGNRWLKAGGFQNYNRFKLILNWIFQWIFRSLYWTRLGDLTYGFKVLSSEIVKSVQWKGTHHEIYIETTIKPLKQGYYLEQIPTVWIGRKEGVSKNTFSRNFRYVRLALKTLFRP